YNFISDEGFAVPVVIEPNSFFTELGNMHGDGRNKVPHDTFNIMHRNTPNPEKTKNMIYAKCIKIIAHLLETVAPPCEAVLLHPLPVVGREAPVLSLHRKIVRWRARLHTHTVEFRLNPGITTVSVNTNWNVTF